MIKNKVLTPVLAGVLGVSVIGSGVGYYLVNKDGTNNTQPKETMDSLKISLTQAEQNVNNSVQDVEKAVKGELDYAYDSSLKISFGEGMNLNGISLQGTDGKSTIKPIEIDTKVKQKGQNSQAEIAAKYNDATIATLETIYARDSKTGYFRIPELNSAYIKATEEELKKSLEDYAKKYQNKLKTSTNQTLLSEKSTDSTDTKKLLESMGIKLPDVNSFDSEKLEKSLKEYFELIKGKLPAKKDGANVSGEIDGNKYDYKTVSYSISGKQMQEIINAVVDKMASDADLKKLFDDAMAKSKTTTNSTKTGSYADFIAELKKNLTVPADSQNKTASIDIYYDGEDVTGASITYDSKNIAKIVVVNQKDVNAVDAVISENGSSLTVKGSAKLVDGTANGTYVADFVSKTTGSSKITLGLDKVVVKDDYFNGTISVSFETTGTTGDKTTGAVKISGDCTKDKKDIKFTVDADGKNMVTIQFKLNKTEASDVTIPTGKTYSLNEFDQYKATCDVENFKAGINDALGTNVFGIFDSFSNIAKSTTVNGSVTTSTSQSAPDGLEYYTF